jgi:hypothetical protein
MTIGNIPSSQRSRRIEPWIGAVGFGLAIQAQADNASLFDVAS